MSNSTALQKEQSKPVIVQYMEKYKAQIAAALPKHMTPDRMARIVTTEIRKVPKLLECNPTSLFGAVIQASQLGLEPGSALGHCYLIPFNNRKDRTVDVNLIIGYKGMIDLARRSGQIISIEARTVYEQDEFSYRFGLDPDLQHRPFTGPPNARGNITHFYAVARLKGGGVQWDVLTKAEVDVIRDGSQGKNQAPWRDHYAEMGKKSVIRKLFKYLPVSIEMQTAIGLDEQTDADVSQNNRAVIEGEFMDMGSADTGDDQEPAAEEAPQTRTSATSSKLRQQAQEPKPETVEVPQDLDGWITRITSATSDSAVFDTLELAKSHLQGEDLKDLEIIGSNKIDELAMEAEAAG